MSVKSDDELPIAVHPAALPVWFVHAQAQVEILAGFGSETTAPVTFTPLKFVTVTV